VSAALNAASDCASLPYDIERLALEWRVVPGFPSYEIRGDGTIRRVVAGRYRRGKGGPGASRKNSIGDHGYPVATLRNGKQHTCLVHRLLAEAFFGPPPAGKDWVAHGDDNKLHCHIRNLRWASPPENWQDGLRNGRQRVGALSPKTKTTEEDRLKILAAYVPGQVRMQDIADQFGVSRPTVSRIIEGKGWRGEGRGQK